MALSLSYVLSQQTAHGSDFPAHQSQLLPPWFSSSHVFPIYFDHVCSLFPVTPWEELLTPWEEVAGFGTRYFLLHVGGLPFTTFFAYSAINHSQTPCCRLIFSLASFHFGFFIFFVNR